MSIYTRYITQVNFLLFWCLIVSILNLALRCLGVDLDGFAYTFSYSDPLFSLIKMNISKLFWITLLWHRSLWNELRNHAIPLSFSMLVFRQLPVLWAEQESLSQEPETPTEGGEGGEGQQLPVDPRWRHGYWGVGGWQGREVGGIASSGDGGRGRGMAIGSGEWWWR